MASLAYKAMDYFVPEPGYLRYPLETNRPFHRFYERSARFTRRRELTLFYGHQHATRCNQLLKGSFILSLGLYCPFVNLNCGILINSELPFFLFVAHLKLEKYFTLQSAHMSPLKASGKNEDWGFILRVRVKLQLLI